MIYLSMMDYPMFFLLLSTWIFCAEQVEGDILSNFYWGGWVAYEILVTAQRPNSSFPFWI